MNAEIVVQPDASVNLVRYGHPAEYGLWIESPFCSYAVAYIEGVMDLLAAVTEDAVQLAAPGPDDDPDWLMDCQDYHDVELLLDLSGNLDAPL